MSGPTIRVLTLLELLQTHGRMTGTELARRLEVDKRTVRRYIRALEDLGIPVTTEQGRDGGYRLMAGFKLPPMMFTNEETLALSLGLLAASALQMADTQPAISSVQAKLERVMPDKLKSRARAISEHIRLMLPSSLPEPSPTHLEPLLTAIQAQQAINLSYATEEQGLTNRRVEPYGLLFRRGRWYVSGYCHLRRDLRTFRLDRIQRVQLLALTFIRPDGFDAAEHFRHSLNNMQGNLHIRVLLHTDRERAFDMLGSTAAMLEERPDGLLLDIRSDCAQWFGQWLCQMPFDFTVIEPEELKQAIQDQAQRLMTLAGR
ncbi:helix-turn-helix transcriptional regulator [Bowmanella dokdonensis]|uniref:YafY family transcriptional regulator n=1 Tax=Bowmanella dokdonensis TaxID=751969 RepID=A0A939DKE8_9ALTE|nr:YafY family protein [Bowmanella dokdonensis]MBN7824195.1 YafY family transcriptional regulator [Bowmanella dokdonensis]